jgi:molecular chaperone DnaK
MEQLGDKVESGEKERIESAIKDLEEAMKGEDKDRIESLTKALGDASAKMAERLYGQQGEAGGGETGPTPGGGAEKGAGGKDDVVDAEFEEVKDDKK